MFWLHFNKGRYFSTRAKSALTIINVGVLVIGFTIVCEFSFSFDSLLIRILQCGLGLYDYTCLEDLSTKVLPISVGPVPTSPSPRRRGLI
jgi:hypothetical protein